MNPKPFIKLPSLKGVELVDVKSIISVCSNDKTCCFTLEGEREINFNISLGKVNELLNHSFFVRCHNRCIINVYKVKEIFSGTTAILLSNDTKFSISRTYKENFRDAIEAVCIGL